MDSATYDNQDRVLTYGSIAYSYNRNGNLERKNSGSDTTRNEYYVFGNREMVKISNGDSITYFLDGTNRRVGKRRNGAFVQGFLFHSKLNPVAEVDSAGNVLARFVYGSKGNVPDQMIWNDTTYRIISDHLGSPRLVVNTSTGAVTQRMDYDEFGNVTYDSNPGFQPFGFAGGLYDADTKLVRFGARDYSSQSGRWTTKDPIGFGGDGYNLYGYVEQNPINTIDPTGLAGWHTDYGKLGEKLIHYGEYRFNEFGKLVEHTGKVIGEASGKAKKALDFIKSKKPDFFKSIRCIPEFLVVPCFIDPTQCIEPPGLI